MEVRIMRGHVMLAGIALLLVAFFFRGDLGPLARPVLLLGVALLTAAAVANLLTSLALFRKIDIDNFKLSDLPPPEEVAGRGVSAQQIIANLQPVFMVLGFAAMLSAMLFPTALGVPATPLMIVGVLFVCAGLLRGLIRRRAADADLLSLGSTEAAGQRSSLAGSSEASAPAADATALAVPDSSLTLTRLAKGASQDGGSGERDEVQTILREIRGLHDRLDPVVERLYDVDSKLDAQRVELRNRFDELSTKLLSAADPEKVAAVVGELEGYQFWSTLEHLTRRELTAAELSYRALEQGRQRPMEALSVALLYCRSVDREWQAVQWSYGGRNFEYKSLRNDVVHGRSFGFPELTLIRSYVWGSSGRKPELLPDLYDETENQRRRESRLTR